MLRAMARVVSSPRLREHLATHAVEDRAMSSKDLRDIRLSDAALEPLNEAPTPTVEAPLAGRAKFTANTRGKVERRNSTDRREAIRFQEDRRAGTDRRPRKGWDKGKIL